MKAILPLVFVTTGLAFSTVFSQEAPLTSQPLEGWGEPVDGISVRLHADKSRWRNNETPAFTFDVRNRGDRTYIIFATDKTGRFEVNGVWFQYLGEVIASGGGIRPGEDRTGTAIRINEDGWRGESGKLVLNPGSHTIRFAPEFVEMDSSGSFTVPSNPVEIEIIPGLFELTTLRLFGIAATLVIGAALMIAGITRRQLSKFYAQ